MYTYQISTFSSNFHLTKLALPKKSHSYVVTKLLVPNVIIKLWFLLNYQNVITKLSLPNWSYQIGTFVNLPNCHYQIVVTKLSLPNCRCQIVVAKLSLPNCHVTKLAPYQIVITILSLPNCHYQSDNTKNPPIHRPL